MLLFPLSLSQSFICHSKSWKPGHFLGGMGEVPISGLYCDKVIGLDDISVLREPRSFNHQEWTAESITLNGEKKFYLCMTE